MIEDPPKKTPLEVEQEAKATQEEIQEEVKKDEVKQDETQDEAKKDEAKFFVDQLTENNPNASTNKATLNTSESQTAKEGTSQGVTTTKPTYDPNLFNELKDLYGMSTPRMADPTERKYYTEEGRRAEAALSPQVEIEGVNSIYDVYGDGYINKNGINRRALKAGFDYDNKGNIINADGNVVFGRVPNRYGNKDVEYLMEKLKNNKLTKAEYEALDLRKKGIVQGLANLITAIGDAAVATPMKGRDVAPVQARNMENPYFDQADQREALGEQEAANYYKHLGEIEKENSDKISKALEGSKGSRTDKQENNQSISQTQKTDQSITASTEDYFKKVDDNLARAKLAFDKKKHEDENPSFFFTLDDDGKPKRFEAKKLVTKNGYRKAELDQAYNESFYYLKQYYPLEVIKAFYDRTFGVGNWKTISQKRPDGTTYDMLYIISGKNKSGKGASYLTEEMKLSLVNFALQGAVNTGDKNGEKAIGTPIDLRLIED